MLDTWEAEARALGGASTWEAEARALGRSVHGSTEDWWYKLSDWTCSVCSFKVVTFVRSLHIKSLWYRLPERSALDVGSIPLRLQTLSVLGVQRSLVQSSNLMSTDDDPPHSTDWLRR